jgi:hypothetical protein
VEEEQYIRRLQKGIDRRQEELRNSAEKLAQYARRLGRRSAVTKVALVVLGAFSATKAVADQLFGSGNTGSLVVYALAGMTTAAIAGLDAAFRWDRRSIDLGALAAESLSRMREVDTEYRSSAAATTIPMPEKEQAAIKVLALQDKSLEEVQAESTKLGINITFDLYPPSETAPVKPPYPA